MALQIPLVTPDGLRTFHAKHFPGVSLPQVPSYEATAQADEEYYEEEDDSLGYYPDGVKRTLTDEQIALFRHTEIQTILRGRRRKREAEQEAREEAAAAAAQQPEPASAKVPTPPTIPAAAPVPTADSADHPMDDSMSISSASDTTPPSITAAPPKPAQPTPPPKTGISHRVQDGRVEKVQQWKKDSGKLKGKNAKNRKANLKKRKERRRQKREGSVTTGKAGVDDESDEWDPWHQATGPDNVKDTTVDLDY